MKKFLIYVALLCLINFSLVSCTKDSSSYSGIWQSISENDLSVRISFNHDPYSFTILIAGTEPVEFIVDAKSIKNERGAFSFYAKRIDENNNEINNLITIRKTSNENQNSNINISFGGIGSESGDLGEFRFIRSHKRLIPSLSKVAAGYESLFKDKKFLEIYSKIFGEYGDKLQKNLSVSSGLKLLPDGTYFITGIAPHSIGGSGIITISDSDVEGAIFEDEEENIYRTRKDNKVIDQWIYENSHKKVYIIGDKIHKPRFGKISIDEKDKNSIYGNVVIKLNDKDIYDYEKKKDVDVVAVEVEELYNLENEDVYIIGNSSGGTACPRLYKIVSVKPDLSYHVSDSFGNCSDLFDKFVKKFTDKSVEIEMPSENGKKVKFLYKDHNVSEIKAQ